MKLPQSRWSWEEEQAEKRRRGAGRKVVASTANHPTDPLPHDLPNFNKAPEIAIDAKYAKKNSDYRAGSPIIVPLPRREEY
jgi:hypothetical protein